MNGLFAKVILGWVRTGIACYAGSLAAQGYLTGAESQEVTAAFVALIPIAFSAYDKWHATQAADFAARTGIAPVSQAVKS